MSKNKKAKKIKSVSFKPEKINYDKVKHATSVDQSDRHVPYNLRQSGPTKVELLISTRVRKSPYWHLSMRAGCWRATVYNRVYHPRGYVRPEKGGAMVEYAAIKNHVTMWNVAVERQIRVKGPDAEKFTDYVITRDATKISTMRGRYVILCNYKGGVLNDPVLMRVADDEFWFSLSDSDIGMYLQGVNADKRFNVDIDEIEVYRRVENGDFYKHITIPFDSLDFSITDYNILDNTYYYYLSPVDKCGNSYVLPSNLFLSDTSIANTLNLNYKDNLYFTWNNYEGFFSGVDSYNIFTNINNVYNNILNIDNNYFPFELQDYGRSCFYLYAIEDFNNMHGFQDTSFSNKVCLQQPPLVFFPNTFSPNSDNKNDVFGPSIEGAGDISYYCFNILDKWGNIIFNSIDRNIHWNGLIKGSNAPIGVYFYDLVFDFPENNIYNTSGSIYLIR